MLPLYFEPKNLPEPPADLVNEVLRHWVEKYKSLKIIKDYPAANMVLSFQHNNIREKRISTFDPIKHQLADWLCANVADTTRPYSNWILRVLHLYSAVYTAEQRVQIYEKHLDSVYSNTNLEHNNYVLIYNLTDSDGDLVYYQEKDKPLIRKDRPVFIGTNSETHQLPHETLIFNNCVEICRYNPSPRTWYVSRIDVIHSVENANQVPRIALQLRLSEREVLSLFSEFNIQR